MLANNAAAVRNHVVGPIQSKEDAVLDDLQLIRESCTNRMNYFGDEATEIDLAYNEIGMIRGFKNLRRGCRQLYKRRNPKLPQYR